MKLHRTAVVALAASSSVTSGASSYCSVARRKSSALLAAAFHSTADDNVLSGSRTNRTSSGTDARCIAGYARKRSWLQLRGGGADARNDVESSSQDSTDEEDDEQNIEDDDGDKLMGNSNGEAGSSSKSSQRRSTSGPLSSGQTGGIGGGLGGLFSDLLGAGSGSGGGGLETSGLLSSLLAGVKLPADGDKGAAMQVEDVKAEDAPAWLIVRGILTQFLLHIFAIRVAKQLPSHDVSSVRLARIIFCAYLIVAQLVTMAIRVLIWKANDQTVVQIAPLDKNGPFGKIIEFAKGKMGSSEGEMLSVLLEKQLARRVNVKAYDMALVDSLRRNQALGAMVFLIVHRLFGANQPLVYQAITGLWGLLSSPLVHVYLLKRKPEGRLARPFKKAPGMMEVNQRMQRWTEGMQKQQEEQQGSGGGGVDGTEKHESKAGTTTTATTTTATLKATKTEGKEGGKVKKVLKGKMVTVRLTDQGDGDDNDDDDDEDDDNDDVVYGGQQQEHNGDELSGDVTDSGEDVYSGFDDDGDVDGDDVMGAGEEEESQDHELEGEGDEEMEVEEEIVDEDTEAGATSEEGSLLEG